MRIMQTIKRTLIIIAATCGLIAITASTAYAATPSPSSSSSTCGTTKTQFIQCSSETGIGTISDLIKMTVSILTVIIGIVATGGIAYAALLYASAKDDQNKVSNALTIIRNIVIGLLLYGFTIAIINWLIPGGVIGTPTPSPSPSTSASPAP
jgi:hypothetical protein